jgi:predicted transcriptional regulator
MKAKDIMVKEFETVSSDAPLLEAIAKLRGIKIKSHQRDIRCLLVTDVEGTYQGILTEADVIKVILPWIFREQKFTSYVDKYLSDDIPLGSVMELFHDVKGRVKKRQVKEVMSTGLVTVGEEATLLKMAYLMHRERIKTLPVLKDGKVIGVVFRTALSDMVADELLKKASSSKESG